MKLKIKDSLTNGVMKINVKTLDFRIFSLIVKPTDSIMDVKGMIQVVVCLFMMPFWLRKQPNIKS